MRVAPYYLVAGVALIATLVFVVVRNWGPARVPAVQLAEIQPGPIRHQQLSTELDTRILKFEPIFAEVYPRTHEEWLEGFQRDAHPETEVAIWEGMAAAYQSFTAERSLTPGAKQEAFALLLTRSALDEQQTLAGAKLQQLSREDAETLLRLYSAAPKPVVVEKR